MNQAKYIYIVLCTLLFSACREQTMKQEQQISEDSQPKIITAGGTITEIVHSLGFGEQIIATDKTSTHPASMQQLPSIGYRNQITAEGIISLKADLILAEEDYLPPIVAEQLANAGIQLELLPNEKSVEGTKTLISQLATILKVPEKGQRLISQLSHDLAQVSQRQISQNEQPKVLFVYARGTGTLTIGGTGTFAEEIIQLAGGQLATPTIDGFKPLTTESLVSANPDFILFFNSGLKSLNGIEGALKIQGLAQTTAGKKQQIIAMDGLLLSGFDSRLGKAVIELSQLIHPKSS